MFYFRVIMNKFHWLSILAERRPYNRCSQQDIRGSKSRQEKWNFSGSWDIWVTRRPRIWYIRKTKRVGEWNSWGNRCPIISNRKHSASTRPDQERSIQFWETGQTDCTSWPVEECRFQDRRRRFGYQLCVGPRENTRKWHSEWIIKPYNAIFIRRT